MIKKDVFLSVSKKAIDSQNKDGSMPAGHNGPYYDPETPVRNTSHWAISFAKAYQLTKEDNFKKAMKGCIGFLLKNSSNYYKGYTYLQRNKDGKDTVNGVIGPAWNIEAFVECYKILGDNHIIAKALELYHLLPFDRKNGLWKRRLFNGAIGDIDFTFNHQLWFCAAGCQILSVQNDKKILEEVNLFFDMINGNLRIYQNGLIKHGIRNKTNLKENIKNIIKPTYEIYLKNLKNKSMVYKEIGYHLFNLYAFALIKNSDFFHDFFNSRRFKKILNCTFGDLLLKNLEINNDKKDQTGLKIKTNLQVNRYGFSYNAPGFELPFIQKVFNPENNKISKLVYDRQLSLTYNSKKMAFDKNTDDPITLTARIYELSRYFQ